MKNRFTYRHFQISASVTILFCMTVTRCYPALQANWGHHKIGLLISLVVFIIYHLYLLFSKVIRIAAGSEKTNHLLVKIKNACALIPLIFYTQSFLDKKEALTLNNLITVLLVIIIDEYLLHPLFKLMSPPESSDRSRNAEMQERSDEGVQSSASP